MLDTETKRRIDTARDILVGKVPDPKSQVEQITIALIYKFMADMDAESEEMGGKRTFFSGEWERYGWPKLMRSGLGGHEVLALYGEAISKMPENAGIPALFRDIFKNAYLPYRDPETLKSFLKVIDEFEYDHSERLGDAFEYLLSVLGSQGDAGQFRTPRHIIDFMVEIIDPKKDETILDPACGTAGFLISSYKHIDRNNRDKDGNSTLTPDDKGRLAKNFRGYDISPDMVRLSLVNLYLHGFSDPHIDEYDTLTSDDKWNEFVDVILANPPFMSPKGGIKPHKRFSVQSKRSEVLFVDYIAEHLTPSGRAAIIVPEGIIFQSQTAYKQLRKMLVDEYLVAVISLPAGVFQPYSGVKTSILVFDKSLAKQSDTIGFFKVENDGFSLGAQRREIDKNDLPQIQLELEEHLDALRNKEEASEIQPTLGLVVEKEKIAENGEYNLSGERYREVAVKNTAFPLVKLEDLFSKIRNGVNVKQIDDTGKYRVTRIQTIADATIDLSKTKFTNDEAKPEFFLQKGDILLSHINSYDHLGKSAVFLEDRDDVIHGINLVRFVPEKSKLLPLFASRVFKSHRFIETVKSFAQRAVNQASVKVSDLRSIQIPLPPLEVQKEIVAEIEGYQKVIDGARAVLDNYRPHIPIHPDWPVVELSEITKPEYGFTEKAADDGDARFVRITDISPDGKLRPQESKFITLSDEARASLLSKGDILVARTGATFGKTMIFEEDYQAVFASFLIRLRFPEDRVLPRYYWVFAQSDLYWNQANSLVTGGGQPQFNGNALKKVRIPLPSIEVQQALVREVEAEQALVSVNHELIERMEKKIQAAIARVWGEEETEAE